MHNLDLIVTITGGLAAALACGYVTQRLGLSPIVGYLLGGIAIGGHTPGFVADQALAEQLAAVGVMLLMFGVGLEFQIQDLLAVRRVAVPGAIVQSLVATALGALLARALGWSWSAGLVFGLAISVASTVVLLRVLADNRDLHTPAGHIAIGWLVVEDLFTVLVLVMLPAMFGDGEAAQANVALSLGWSLLKMSVLVVLTFFVGRRVVPWLLERVADTHSRELFTLTVLVLALGIAVGAAKVFGVSMELGAFLAGMVVGSTDFSHRAGSEALPMRDAFAVLFFVSVGMLFNPPQLLDSVGLVAGTLAIILLGKPLAALAIVLWLRYPLQAALSVAAALAQIGEFSFILAGVGKSLGLLTGEATGALVAAAILSIALNPLLYRLVRPAERWLSRHRVGKWLTARAQRHLPPEHLGPPSFGMGHLAVIVGFGPVGQTVTRLLQENGILPTIVELNLETVRRLRTEGLSAVYGDAAHLDTLRSAGVEQAASLVLTSAGMSGSEEVIRQARELNPEIRILARSAYVRELSSLRRAGADLVFSAEGEVALAMTVAILRELGATAEQIDRERDRVQSELFEK